MRIFCCFVALAFFLLSVLSSVDQFPLCVFSSRLLAHHVNPINRRLSSCGSRLSPALSRILLYCTIPLASSNSLANSILSSFVNPPRSSSFSAPTFLLPPLLPASMLTHTPFGRYFVDHFGWFGCSRFSLYRLFYQLGIYLIDIFSRSTSQCQCLDPQASKVSLLFLFPLFAFAAPYIFFSSFESGAPTFFDPFVLCLVAYVRGAVGRCRMHHHFFLRLSIPPEYGSPIFTSFFLPHRVRLFPNSLLTYQSFPICYAFLLFDIASTVYPSFKYLIPQTCI